MLSRNAKQAVLFRQEEKPSERWIDPMPASKSRGQACRTDVSRWGDTLLLPLLKLCLKWSREISRLQRSRSSKFLKSLDYNLKLGGIKVRQKEAGREREREKHKSKSRASLVPPYIPCSIVINSSLFSRVVPCKCRK